MNFGGVTYLDPWSAVAGQRTALALEAELVRETGPGHPLHGRKVAAVARREDRDDVLFVTVDEPQVVAVVHLTWTGRLETDPRCPRATLFASFADWIERGMKADHQDFI